MKHTSVKLNQPIELINITSINPLISKCIIKVCWVGDTPNRNNTIITKDVAAELAQSLPGSPIVGFYSQDKEDFEGHEKTLIIDENGDLRFKEITRPYGFVDLNAKVWFEKFLDDGIIEREYLVTEGYLWTGQYPECQRVIDQGNNQSMELDEDLTKATRANLDNSFFDFFIINEAVMSKLCILGEDIEPCFEGSDIKSAPKIQFSFEDDFKNQLLDMMNELKEYMIKGGNEMPNDNVIVDQPILDNQVVEDGQVVEDPVTPPAADNPIDTPVEGNSGESNQNNFENNTEGNEICPDCGQPVAECTCGGNSYNLEDIPEYVELQGNYETLQTNYNSLLSEVEGLRAFKLTADRKDKQSMINSFYMLSDEDKADVVTNIDTYSLEEIESKLSVICFRNKVSFATQEEDNNQQVNTSYNLSETQQDDLMPAWVKAVKSVKDEDKF